MKLAPDAHVSKTMWTCLGGVGAAVAAHANGVGLWESIMAGLGFLAVAFNRDSNRKGAFEIRDAICQTFGQQQQQQPQTWADTAAPFGGGAFGGDVDFSSLFGSGLADDPIAELRRRIEALERR